MKKFKSIAALILSIFMILSLIQGLSTTAFAANESTISKVVTYGNFETAGVDIKVDNMNFNETATMEYKKQGDTNYRLGHYFVRYDGNHMATSLFNLANDTTYDIKITLNDSDGVSGTNPIYTTVKTKAEFKIPSPLRVVFVSNQTELDKAVTNAKAGDEIRLAPTSYSKGINFDKAAGTATNPIVISSQSATKPLITANIYLSRSKYVIFNNLEVHDEKGDGITINASHHITVYNCYVHDSCPSAYDYANIRIKNSLSGETPGFGNNLILNNIVSDDVHETVTDRQGPGGSNTQAPGQCYTGIKLIDLPGGYNTIRGNLIYGMTDGVHTGADEGQEPVMFPDDKDLLETWSDQNMDFYDNVIHDCKDDAIESDGHAVNSRFFRNRLGRCQCAISTAPIYPGPIFFVWNYISGYAEQSQKENTDVPGITRGCFFYQNTFASTSPSKYCFVRGNGHVQDFTFMNNIFYARGIIFNGYQDHPDTDWHKDEHFDYDLLYSTKETPIGGNPNPYPLFVWTTYVGDPLNGKSYGDIPSFAAATGMEVHGTFGDPKLNFNTLAGYDPSTRLVDLSISADSAAIDAGVFIPGINDDYVGNAPDCGAFEYGKAIKTTPTPTPYPIAASSITVNALGKKVNFTKTPIIDHDTILVQASVLAKSLGASSKYDSKKKTITITKGKTIIVMTISSLKAKVGSKTYTLTKKPVLYKNEPFVPAKFVAESLKYKYSYNYGTGVLTIKA